MQTKMKTKTRMNITKQRSFKVWMIMMKQERTESGLLTSIDHFERTSVE